MTAGSPRGDDPRRAALEAAIAAAPDDPEAYLVYADWLQARGGADQELGELIVLDHAGPGGSERERRRRHLLPQSESVHIIADRCRWGFHRRVHLSMWQAGRASWVPERHANELARVLKDPTLRFVEALELAANLDGTSDPARELAALAGMPRPTILRRLLLYLSDDDRHRGPPVAAGDVDLGVLWPTFESLEHLDVSCERVALGAAPKSLRSLRLHARHIAPFDLAALTGLRWVSVSLDAYDATAAADLAAELERRRDDLAELRLDGGPLLDLPP